MSHTPTFRFLRLDGGWPLVERHGIEIASSGALTLARLPALGPSSEPLSPVPGLDGPAGIGVDPCGDLYVADPARHRVLRIDGCDGHTEPLACLGGRGSGPGQLDGPRGVAVGRRGELYVADSGNHRVVVIDLRTGQIRGMWGQPSAWGEPSASDAPGRFSEPWDLAVDAAGDVYVAEPGTLASGGIRSGGRVQKFHPNGSVDAAFAATLAAQTVRPEAPVAVTIASLSSDLAGQGDERLLVLDRQPSRVLVYRLDGTYDEASTARWAQVVGIGQLPMSIAAGDGVLYVADAASGRVLVFDADGHLLGSARGTEATPAGLALDCRGRLVVHPGGGGGVRRALGLPEYAECGTLLAGPFDAATEPTRWQHLELTAALAAGTHLRVFTLASDTLDGAPGNRPDAPFSCMPGVITPASDDADTPLPTRTDRWRAAPWDATELFVLNAPARYLWIAVVLQGDGTATPTIEQIRLAHDRDGWLRSLPAIYRRDETSRQFLEPALAMFERMLGRESELIDALPRLFDPAAAPDGVPRPAWLDWLAGWVGAELEESWGESTRRSAVAEAFARAGRRGTLEGLREAIALHTGATPEIEELALGPGIWSLGVTALGADTALAASAPAGAVLDRTAIVDRSHLIDNDDYGAPVFDDVAHRFVVRVHAAQVAAPGALARVRRVIDREKSAHTTYHLCVVQPTFRVGAQARLGIDAIVGGPPAPHAFDGTRALGHDTVLAGEQGGALTLV